MHDQHPGAGPLLPPPPSHDPYLTSLAPDSRACYRAASPGADLASEIRLLRAVLSTLAEDLSGNHKSITTTVLALVRALTLQQRLLGGDGCSSLAAGPAGSPWMEGRP